MPELICILCVSKKKHAFESLTIKDINDFNITNLTMKLKAPNITFCESIYKSKDPKELFIPINEFSYQISKVGNDTTAACYWFEWILQYEIICKQKNIITTCERRTFAPVEEKLQMDIIWIVWDIIITRIKKKKFSPSLQNINITIKSILY